jgi:ubiquinone/menaquinone biosynthesis C-methylase UbiE
MTGEGMLEADKVFAGFVPENYDCYMVPLIFQPYAADLAERVASFSPGTVLEIAAGTGVVTRALAPRLSSGASYIATDLNKPMLDYAASRQSPDGRIQWRQADALALPFQDAAFDLVCCQFGAMFFSDRPAAYREAKRVLKPHGRLLFGVWDRIEENVFADDVTKALAKIFRTTRRFFWPARPTAITIPYGSPRARGRRFLGCGDRDGSRTEQRSLAAPSGRRILPRNSSSQRDRGPGRKPGFRNRSGRLHDRRQARQRRGRRQNSGARSHGR